MKNCPKCNDNDIRLDTFVFNDTVHYGYTCRCCYFTSYFHSDKDMLNDDWNAGAGDYNMPHFQRVR